MDIYVHFILKPGKKNATIACVLGGNFMMGIRNILAGVFALACSCCHCAWSASGFDNGKVRYKPYDAPKEYCALLDKLRAGWVRHYDAEEAMWKTHVSSWQYHIDNVDVDYHDVMGTLRFIQLSLDTMNDAYLPEMRRSLGAVIALQQSDKNKRHYGVWPYYKEEPVMTKKSPVDYNWADFPAVALLDIYTGHADRLGEKTCAEIRRALISAAESIQRRNVSPSYTNIAIMGTYVTYFVSHLFDIPEMKAYAKDRLNKFYEYTVLNGGFNEFNSPTYTIVALSELSRMRLHISDKEDYQKVEHLSVMLWEILARHYHAPTKQWTGPHSRCYQTLILPPAVKPKNSGDIAAAMGRGAIFYDYIQHATNSEIDFGRIIPWNVRKLDMRMPEHLYGYFLNPKYPRLEIDKFTKNSDVVGTTWLTSEYAFSTANLSTMWNQARPLLMYFKNESGAPAYLQARFMHDGYDFSSVFFTSAQDKDRALCGMSFITDMGDKHIHIDRTKGKINAQNLSLRFQVGNSSKRFQVDPENPQSAAIFLPGQKIDVSVKAFGGMRGKFEVVKDKKFGEQLEYVIYSGPKREFKLTDMPDTALFFSFEINPSSAAEISAERSADTYSAKWKNLNVRAMASGSPIKQHNNLLKKE